MPNESIQLRQGTGGRIQIQHIVDGMPLEGINAAKYQLFNRDGSALLTLSLGGGISWDAGVIAITITKEQADQLVGFYSHECVVIDVVGRDLCVLDGPIQFEPRRVRISL